MKRLDEIDRAIKPVNVYLLFSLGKTQSKTSKCSDLKSSHTAINDCLLPIGEDVHLQLVDGRRFLSDLNNTKLLCRYV